MAAQRRIVVWRSNQERLEHDERNARTGPVAIVAELRAWQHQVRIRLGSQRIPESSAVIRRLRKKRVRIAPRAND